MDDVTKAALITYLAAPLAGFILINPTQCGFTSIGNNRIILEFLLICCVSIVIY